MTPTLCLLILGAAPPQLGVDLAGHPLPAGAVAGLVPSGGQAAVEAAAFRPGGRVLATNAADGARFWHLPTMRIQRRVPAPRGIKAEHSLLDGRGEVALWAPREGAIHAYDLVGARALPVIKLAGKMVEVAVSFDGSTAACIDARGGWLNIRVWQPMTGHELARFEVRGDPDLPCQLAISPDGARLAVVLGSGGRSAYAGVVRIPRGVATETLGGATLGTLPAGPKVVSLTFSPDGETLAVGRMRGLSLLDGRTGKPVREIELPCPSPRRLASAGSYEDAAAALKGAGWQAARAVAFSPDFPILAAASTHAPDPILLADTRTGRSWPLHTKGLRPCLALAFSPAGSSLAASDPDGRTLLWSLLPVPVVAGAPVPRPLEPLAAITLREALAVLVELERSQGRAVRLRARPRPAAVTDVERINGWVVLARDENGDLREKARDALVAAGEWALPALRRALESGEWRGMDRLALEVMIDDVRPTRGRRERLAARAVEVLVSVGSHEARLVLKKLAGGDPEALLTKEAKAALSRLEER